jgi:ketosteroid isomerase-like protein
MFRTADLVLCCLFFLASGCTRASEPVNDGADDRVISAVRAVLEMQQEAWNRGDIDAFMDGYYRGDTTTFVSGDELTRGWQTVLDRYKQRYKSREDMGQLSFSELEVKPVASNLVVADGQWQLTRRNDSPHGRFTLLFVASQDHWRIIHDTTTSAAN